MNDRSYHYCCRCFAIALLGRQLPKGVHDILLDDGLQTGSAGRRGSVGPASWAGCGLWAVFPPLAPVPIGYYR